MADTIKNPGSMEPKGAITATTISLMLYGVGIACIAFHGPLWCVFACIGAAAVVMFIGTWITARSSVT